MKKIHRAEQCKRNLRVPLFLLPLTAILTLTLHAGSPSSGTAVPEKVRVNILSKYRLQQLKITATQGRCFIGEKSLCLEKAEAEVKSTGSGVSISVKNGPMLSGKEASFPMQGSWSVTFSRDEGPVTRHYSGGIEIHNSAKGLVITVELPLEDYVRSVAVAELGFLLNEDPLVTAAPQWRRELLAAMEITVRSYVIAQGNRHHGEKFRFCDLTHCMNFPGLPAGDDPLLRESLSAGEIMTGADGHPVNAYFHSCCGGTLSGPETYWSGHEAQINFRRGPDRLNSGDEFLCGESPNSAWTSSISAAEMDRILKTAGCVNIETRRLQNRVSSLAFRTTAGGSGLLSVSDFLSRTGKILGWARLKSNCFTVERKGDIWIFHGRGFGHGVGLCQWGAGKMARLGYSHRDILSFYFGNPRITGVLK
jgi:SpoIID/LytB domain protein